MAISWSRLKHSFCHAFVGIKSAFTTQQNFRIHLYATIFIIFLSFFFSISEIEWVVVINSIILVLITELLNTAIEFLADFIEPRQNPKIKLIKDISAASVLIAVFLAIVIGCIVFIPKIIAYI